MENCECACLRRSGNSISNAFPAAWITAPHSLAVASKVQKEHYMPEQREFLRSRRRSAVPRVTGGRKGESMKAAHRFQALNADQRDREVIAPCMENRPYDCRMIVPKNRNIIAPYYLLAI